jgi:putative addiction module killer protein
MARHKKAEQGDTRPEIQEENILRLWFRGELLELAPTTEYPIRALQTEEYEAWIESIVDLKTSTRININVDKMQRGLFRDWKEVGAGVFELRLDFGPGYRGYYAKYGKIVIILLGGGVKSSQRKDIAEAKRLWEGLKIEATQV